MRAFVVTVIVLTVAALGADRLAERVATDRAESRLTAHGVKRPQVDAGGFPFLTQLLQRRFSEVRLTGPGLVSGSGRARDIEVTARDVDLPPSGDATVGSLRATGLVTYDEVVRRSRVRGVELRPAGGGRVRITGDARVLGRTAPVAAVGRVVAGGRSIRVEPTDLQVDGARVDSAALLDALGARLTLVYRLSALPRGVRVTVVDARREGFRVVVTGTDVTVPTG